MKGMILKVDLSKAFDRVSWLYLRMLLTHIGFHFDFIKWIMCCICNIPFSVLVNGADSPFFTQKEALDKDAPYPHCSSSSSWKVSTGSSKKNIPQADSMGSKSKKDAY